MTHLGTTTREGLVVTVCHLPSPATGLAFPPLAQGIPARPITCPYCLPILRARLQRLGVLPKPKK
jgi:hypothetical protein